MNRMMVVCAIYDAAIKEFMQPFFVRTEDECKRMIFSSLGEESNLSKHPQDFTVYVLGEFDTSLGIFNCHDPKCLMSSQELVVFHRSVLNGGQPHSDPRQVDLED